jgi:hypothetical protein
MKVINSPDNELYAGLPDKAKSTFSSKPIPVQVKMLITASDKKFSVIFDLFAKEFPTLKDDTEVKVNCRYLMELIVTKNISIDKLIADQDEHVYTLLEQLMSSNSTSSDV